MLLMVFTIKRNKFGIPLEQVEYIAEEIGTVDTTMASEHIRGTAILRGEVISVYDLVSRLGYDSSVVKKPVMLFQTKKGNWLLR